MSMMLRPGQQVCPRCGGQGCWSCDRTGLRTMCPQCSNSENTLITRSGDEFKCLACGYQFMKNGDRADYEDEDDRAKPKAKAPTRARR